ncbi:MAG: methionyl-tRNA formyltransferase [Oscillospiraceae bacterium]
MRIVFMGTPDFAEESLRALLEAGEDVTAVFTQPDKPRGRGMRESFSPVKALAAERGIPVYQPVTFKDGAATELLRTLAPELLVVVAYGRILPQAFLDVAKYGSINVHGSLLPKYRGAAPIQWAVLNGDKTTGVSVQYMAAAMDAGDVIAARETEIGEFETAGELFDRLKTLGAELLTETVRKIASGSVIRVPQNEADATYTKMLDKNMSPIDWNKSPREIVKHICGLNPWPVATTELGGVSFRVFGAEYTDTRTALAPGKIISAGKAGIEVACGGGRSLRITEVQAAGKKRMSAAAFLLGHPMKADG